MESAQYLNDFIHFKKLYDKLTSEELEILARSDVLWLYLEKQL